jgi:hypothetical protein
LINEVISGRQLIAFSQNISELSFDMENLQQDLIDNFKRSVE